MRFVLAIAIVTLLLALYEAIYLATNSFQFSSTATKILTIDVDGLIDSVIGLYSIGVLIFILRYRSWRMKLAKTKTPSYFNAFTLRKQGVTQENWKEKLHGVWQQFKAEGLDEFAALTEPSAMRRTLGAIAFFKVRHTISIENGYFILQRDLGMAVSVWNLKARIGTSKETAEQVSVPVESGGNYLFRIWIDEERKELHMESAPEQGNEGVTTIQTRSLIDNDLMKMVSIYYLPPAHSPPHFSHAPLYPQHWSGKNPSAQEGEMVSYFQRVDPNAASSGLEQWNIF
jgi:hypothetical protein